MTQYDDFAKEWSKQFEINLQDLENEVCNQASAYSYYATRAAKAKGEMERIKFLSDKKMAEVKAIMFKINLDFSQEVIGYTKSGEPKYRTVQACESAAKSDTRYLMAIEEYYTLYNEYLEKREMADIYEGDVRASAQKGDALKSLSFSLYTELKNKDLGGV